MHLEYFAKGRITFKITSLDSDLKFLYLLEVLLIVASIWITMKQCSSVGLDMYMVVL
jgi:hypothetical protein